MVLDDLSRYQTFFNPAVAAAWLIPGEKLSELKPHQEERPASAFADLLTRRSRMKEISVV
jgi:hypothetical protein